MGSPFPLGGNMAVGVSRTTDGARGHRAGRPGPRTAAHAALRHDGPADEGLGAVAPEGAESDAESAAWVGRGVAFARSLPAKG